MRSSVPKMTNVTENGEKDEGDTPGDPSLEPDRCPICLSPPGPDRAIPENCSHVFCLPCILTWAQTVPSCPVDRRRFNLVYRLDTILGAVKIPMSEKAKQEELQVRCYRKEMEETKGRTLKRRQVETTLEGVSHAKVKEAAVRKCTSHGSKCKQEALGLKKKMGKALCGPHLRTPLAGGTSTALTQCCAEVLGADVWEYHVLQKQCRLQLQDRLWLRPSALIPASGLSRYPGIPEPLRSPSPPSTSAAGLHAGRFVFQVEECIVTCARGGEKKAVRPSNSRGSKNQTEATTARRSTRHSQVEDLPSPSSPHSGSDDSASDSPMRQDPQPDQKATTRRNAKQGTKQRPQGRRRNQKPPQEPFSSPEQKEEEEGEEDKGETDEDSGSHISGHQIANAQTGTSKQHTNQEVHLSISPEPSSPHEDSCSVTTDHNSQQEGSPPITPSDRLQQEDDRTENWAGSDDDTRGDTDSGGMKTVSRVKGSPPLLEEQEQEEMEGHLDIASSEQELQMNPEVSPNEELASEQEREEASSTGEQEDLPSPPHEEVVKPEWPSDNTASGMNFTETAVDSAKLLAGVEGEELSQDSEPDPFSALSNGDPSRNRIKPNRSLPDQCPNTDSNAPALKWTSETSHKESPSEDNTDLVPMECDSPSSETQEVELEQEAKSTGSECMLSQAVVSPHDAGQEKKEPRQRRSRFHSPSTTWSPKREFKTDQNRSQSRERDTAPPSRHRSRTRSRDRDRERDRDRDHSRDGSRNEGGRRTRSRERRSRRRSRSRSRSRNRTFGRGSPSERESGRHSPRRRDRRVNDGWRNNWGNDQTKRDDQERPGGNYGKDVDDSDKGGPAERSRGQNPDGGKEKSDLEVGGRNSGVTGASRWEEIRGGWNLEGGRDIGRGRGGSWDEPPQNRWQMRNSGTANSSGNEPHGRFGDRRAEPEPLETPVDRSGWSSASSRAVRRTLPADVQNYYSRRGRNSTGPGSGWNRQEEETPAQDPPHSEGSQLPPSAPLQPMAVLQFPMGAHVPPISLQPPPFGVPPQVPVPIHPAMPLFQGLPPPPPPPPPLQQVDGRPAKHPVSSIPGQAGNRFSAPLLAGHTKVPGSAGHPVALPSSTTLHGAADKLSVSKDFAKVEACADSSKKEKKLQIQEKAVQEVKMAIKPFYQNKEITKEEYKEIVRKAVEKVCHSKSGEVNSGKVANLVKAYVEKYKHVRKNKSDVHGKC